MGVETVNASCGLEVNSVWKVTGQEKRVLPSTIRKGQR